MTQHSGKQPAAVQQTSSIRMISTLGLVAMISGLSIVLLVSATEARIEANKRSATEGAVFAVLPGAEEQAAFVLQDGAFSRTDNPPAQADRVYAGYDGGGALVGLAIEATGQGYGGPVKVMVGYDPNTQEIVGYQVLQSLETPGLGDRIAKDPQFLENFNGLDVALDAEKDNLAHPLELVKQGEKTEPWQIDGISGATISSRAVASGLEDRLPEILPVIQSQLDTFRGQA